MLKSQARKNKKEGENSARVSTVLLSSFAKYAAELQIEMFSRVS